jgi:outer membrane protein assembly factor BamE (lipoprotein component of BamABCDE complex)
MRISVTIVAGMALASIVTGCMTAAEHQQSLGSATERQMTLGVVQKEIRVGMSQADVASALGSPNIVTKDAEGKETWVYDKIATEASYSQSSGGGYATLILLGIGGSREAGAYSTTQRTLTVVIKFDKNSSVESFKYHATKF